MNSIESKYFVLKIVSPDQVWYGGPALSVKFQSLSGEMMILAEHEHYITALAEGIIQYETSEGTYDLLTTGGVCRFLDNMCEIALFAPVGK